MNFLTFAVTKSKIICLSPASGWIFCCLQAAVILCGHCGRIERSLEPDRAVVEAESCGRWSRIVLLDKTALNAFLPEGWLFEDEETKLLSKRFIIR